MRAELRVDECVLERLLVAGVLDREEEVDPEKEEGHVHGGCGEDEEATLPETPAEESDSSAGSRGGMLRRSCRKVWRKISGKRGGESK